MGGANAAAGIGQGLWQEVVVVVDVKDGVELEWLEYGRVKGGVEKDGVGVWFDVGEEYEWYGTVEGGVGSVVVDEYFEVIMVGWFVCIRGDDCVGFG